MIQKLKKCCKCNKLKVIWKTCEREKFCKNCWSCLSGNKGIKPTVKPLRSRSSKRVMLDTEYSKLREKFLKEYNMCDAHLNECSTYATDIHHTAGRGKYYLDITTWKALCRKCHMYIENHPNFAKEMGFSKDRLT